ncbi:MAG: glycosyltransferase [Anaerolineales bacterium]|nr:glycosyltransferase [Anaerolineales bacterium]
MKVFIPAHLYGDSFAENVSVTLALMGHEVKTLGYVNHNIYGSRYRFATRILFEHIRRGAPSREECKMLKTCREFKPDLFLSTTTSIHPEILEGLRKVCRGGRVIWWGDSPANNERWGFLDPEWDYIFLKDHFAVNKLRLIGRNAFLLHEAMNPCWHKPLASQRNDEVIIAGNYYSFRQFIVLKLMDDGISTKLFGPPPPRWAHKKIKEKHTGRYIIREEKSRIFGEGMACLNTFSMAEGDSLNCRAFEIAGSGGLQIIEHRNIIEKCFEPNKEILVFNSYDELNDHIFRARKYPKEMATIRRSGTIRALAEHTYKHRLTVILNTLNG